MKLMLWIVVVSTVLFTVFVQITTGSSPLVPISAETRTAIGLGIGVTILVIAAVAIMLILFRMIASAPALNESPRSFRQQAKGTQYLIIAAAVLVAIDLFSTTARIGQEAVNRYRTDMSIQQHGQRTTASVLQTYQDHCGKHGCGIYVQYQFTPAAPPFQTSHPVQGTTWVGHTGNRDNPLLDSANATHTIPVAYDLDNPQLSDANFADRVFTTNHARKMYLTVGGLLAFYLVITGIIGFAFYMRARRAA